MTSFVNWLERRDPAVLRAQQYAAMQTDPVVLRWVQRDMEEKEKWQRKRLGLKKDRRSEIRRGL